MVGLGWFVARVAARSGGVGSSMLLLVWRVVAALRFVRSGFPGVSGSEDGAGGAGDEEEAVTRPGAGCCLGRRRGRGRWTWSIRFGG